jgi:hypothetical protein
VFFGRGSVTRVCGAAERLRVMPTENCSDGEQEVLDDKLPKCGKVGFTLEALRFADAEQLAQDAPEIAGERRSKRPLGPKRSAARKHAVAIGRGAKRPSNCPDRR